MGGSPPRMWRRGERAVFTRADGSAVDTADVRHAAQRMAAACGEDPAAFGGKSFRVGGATDLRCVRETVGVITGTD